MPIHVEQREKDDYAIIRGHPQMISGGFPLKDRPFVAQPLYQRLLSEVERLPGVRSASLASALPVNPSRMSPFLAEGQPAVPVAERPIAIVQTLMGRYAQTMGFTTLVLFQLFNAFNARSATTTAFRRSHNPWLWASVALAVVLQVAVVHLPVLNNAFGTAPLDVGQWAVCVALASAVLWVEEARKVFLRRPRGHAAPASAPAETA